MNRLHLHVGVDDLDASLKFYRKLFAAEPTRLEADYAKWMLDDPRINFVISTRASARGVDHVGMQVDDAASLAALRERLRAAAAPMFDEGETTCCYAHSEKSWTEDPSGLAWEAFMTMDEVAIYGTKAKRPGTAACCTPMT